MRLLDVDAAAIALGVSRATVYRWVGDGTLRPDARRPVRFHLDTLRQRLELPAPMRQT